jgi:hypothetical protein
LKRFTHPNVPADSKRRAEALLWNLHLEGPVVDSSGRAVQKLADRLAKVGWVMSVVTVNRLVNGLGDRGGRHGDLYQYNYIAREVSGKMTKRIELIVDPTQVPFPPNPFKNLPVFRSAAVTKSKPVPPDEGETFARQRQFETPEPVAPSEPEPELVELELELELPESVEPEAEPATVGTLEPYHPEEKAHTNGADQGDLELMDLPDDLLVDTNEVRPRTAMDMVSAAISMLSDAMAAHAGEQMHLATDTLDRHIDERLGEYRLLQDRLERTEGKLRHTVTQYEKVVGIARKQRQQIIALQKELARHRPTTPARS